MPRFINTQSAKAIRTIGLAATLLFSATASQALNSSEQRLVDAVTRVYGERAGLRVTTWRTQMSAYQGLSERDQLTRVNQFFNQQINKYCNENCNLEQYIEQYIVPGNNAAK